MRIKDIRRNNLRLLAKSMGGLTALAARIGRKQFQLSHLIGRNPIKNVGDKLAAFIEETLGLPEAWLDKEHADTMSMVKNTDTSSNIHSVPQIEWVQIPDWLQQKQKLSFPSIGKICTYEPVGPKAFALEVKRDDMQDGRISFIKGSIIVVDPDKTPESGAYVIVRSHENAPYFLRQLLIEKGKRFHLKAVHGGYPSFSIADLSSVVGVVRQLTVTID